VKTIIKIGAGLLAYSILTTAAYRIGFSRGKLSTIDFNTPRSYLEKITENEYKVFNPKNNKDYLIDFDKLKISFYEKNDYNSKKELENIFSND
jgi:hypothetical protein